MNSDMQQAKHKIIAAGNRLDRLKLAPATSGNYSIRTAENEMAVTVSGAHKGMLTDNDIMRADLKGEPLEDKTPSAETLLHAALYDLYPDANAILHTHSVANTVLTRRTNDDVFQLRGYEMLKAYPNVKTHDTVVNLPIFNNTQDMLDLSTQLRQKLESETTRKATPAFMIRGHGIYGWGKNMNDALRVIEATEMMLECEMYALAIQGLIQDNKRTE